MDLSINDYVKILEYYKVDTKTYGRNKQKLKQMAEDLLATKLCKCIKKVGKTSNKENDETRAIAICKNSVLKKKNLKNFGFTCKKRAKFVPKKNSSKNLVKMKRAITRRKRSKK